VNPTHPAEQLRKIPHFACALVVLTAGFFLLAACESAQAQNFNVLYAFGAGGDGAQPLAGVTLDRGGNIFGTTCIAGHGNAGTVWELKNHNGTWLLSPLHEFLPANGDGACPIGRVVFGPDGHLYGTTEVGGVSGYLGTVYRLSPPATFCGSAVCYWKEALLYLFTGGSDGGKPWNVDPVFDQAGNLYGTTWQGGINGFGVVFKLTHSGSSWTESVLHSFVPAEGVNPQSTVLLDGTGNIWGTTTSGLNCSGQGSVFELTPSGSGWTANVIHVFQGPPNDGSDPEGGLTADGSGNFYGATAGGGPSSSGALFEVTPNGNSWTYSVPFTGFVGAGIVGSLVRDANGNLYGTAYDGGSAGTGAVFKLTPSGGGWTYTSLHDFTGGVDGANPFGGVTFDANGHIFGTASAGGRYGRGVVWEIVP
jgi:uncharacterized repeat protein (TIGR03803 family)